MTLPSLAMSWSLSERCVRVYVAQSTQLMQHVLLWMQEVTPGTESVTASSSGLEFYPLVLTSGSWPVSPVPTCQLPPIMRACVQQFEASYFRRHTGRLLRWQTALGSADIRMTLADRSYELGVTTMQACLLCMFNTTDKITFRYMIPHIGNAVVSVPSHGPCACRDFTVASGIAPDELKRQLISLSTPKHRILLRSSKVGPLSRLAVVAAGCWFPGPGPRLGVCDAGKRRRE